MKTRQLLIWIIWTFWIVLLWIAIVVAVNAVPPLPSPTPPAPLTGFGALIAGVTAQEKAEWGAGRVQFQVVETPATGLGPEFNGQSCQQCHGQPVVNGKETVGGPAANTETHFFSPSFGFDLFHLSSISPTVQDEIPSDTKVVTVRKSNTTAGLGLIESIPDSAIIANTQNGAGGDGVFGRPAMLSDPVTQAAGPNRVGRFGWKAQHASTTAFAGDALINELGITNRLFGTDIAPHVVNGFALLTAAEPPGITPNTLQDLPIDPTQPEDDHTNPDRVARLTAFMRFNAANPTVPLSQSAIRGEAAFDRIGCARCHTPSYTTGAANGSAALAFKPVALYSDLRLHHMGQLGDGIVQGNAGADEMRTAPLWGLRARSPFLHNGSAATILQAIELHDAVGAESQKIAQRFKHLPVDQQQDILDFLNSI